MLMPPALLVTLMPLPAVSVANVYPLPLPISNWPLVGVVFRLVPPAATGTVPVSFEADSDVIQLGSA